MYVIISLFLLFSFRLQLIRKNSAYYLEGEGIGGGDFEGRKGI